jgi:hypothetical protein
MLHSKLRIGAIEFFSVRSQSPLNGLGERKWAENMIIGLHPFSSVEEDEYKSL